MKKSASAVKTPLKKAAMKAKPLTGEKAPITSKTTEGKAEEPEPAPVVDSKEEVATEVPKAEEAKDALEAASKIMKVELAEEEAEEEDPEEGAEEEAEAEAAKAEEVQNEISDMAKAAKIKKEQVIFVDSLDRDVVEQDLKKVFEKVEIQLLKDFTTNKNKGFAFMKFTNKEQTAKAVSEMKSL